MLERARRAAALLVVSLAAATATATIAEAREAVPEAADPALEARMVRITAQLRCLVCQNQTIADSNADLAVDLRRQTRELLAQGKSDEQVVDYMTARYGDFVLYKPPLKATTLLLWFGPALLLAIGASVLVGVIRQRSRLGDDAFEPDPEPIDASAAATSAPLR